MKSITFPEVTNKIAEFQEEYQTVHVQFQPEDQSVNMCFEFSEQEIEEIIKNKKIWYKQIIGHQEMHPMMLSGFKEAIIKTS